MTISVPGNGHVFQREEVSKSAPTTDVTEEHSRGGVGSEILDIFHISHIPALGIVGWPDAGMARGKNMCVSLGRRIPPAKFWEGQVCGEHLETIRVL